VQFTRTRLSLGMLRPAAALLALTFLTARAALSADAPDRAALVAALPSASAWEQHFEHDILPFWQTPAALGTPIGNFPTARCDDGSVYKPKAPCREYLGAPDWIKSAAGRQYVRMMSRQIYLYCVAFHLTGETKYLLWARDGVRYLLSHAFDKKTGAVVSYWEGGKAFSDFADRTSQDVAYSLAGLSFYYYLTRDAEVLPPILAIERYIRKTYYDQRLGYYRWERQGPEAERLELVAQLDQANAYMVLLAPLLPKAEERQWRGELAQIAKLMRERFFDQESGFFRGTLTQKPGETCIFDREDTDFGHTIKAYWMLYLTGRVLGDKELEHFAGERAPAILERAFLPDTGSWATRPTCGKAGDVDRTSTWWTAAELDQAALTFGLADPGVLRVIPATFDFWLKHMIDPRNGEVWDELAVPGFTPRQRPKIHLWKNGFHTAEHALVGYLLSAGLRGEPALLYYAFPDCKLPADVKPYYYDGAILWHSDTPFSQIPHGCREKVMFSDIR
jgi:mannose/cellobiose epimerase-like protein (N-acyl-D-glucosamine 2-epimerase family)